MKDQFSKKKVAVLGFGLEGRDAVDYLLSQKAVITVFDQKSPSELGHDLIRYQKGGVVFKTGADYLQRSLSSFDLIVRSPGFKPQISALKEAVQKGVTLTSPTKIFFLRFRGKIIGVTGTKGKGTTATLTYKILKSSGRDVHLAGNIGKPMLSLLGKTNSDSWAVLELSSFQLIDLRQSPHLAVVLFITSEHLDYHGSTREYIEAKKNIILHQQPGDYAVFNRDDPVSSRLAKQTKGKVYYFSRRRPVKGCFVRGGQIFLEGRKLGPASDLKIPGSHNQENVCAAAMAAYLAGSSMTTIKKEIFSFTGLEHRLEKVAVVKGVEFYNDSFSTTPETTIAAINSFSGPIILIAGGSPKGSDYSQLAKALAGSRVKVMVLIGQTAEKIRQAVLAEKYPGRIIFRPGDMKTSLKEIKKLAKPGDVVLLSPACASFDMFENYKQRGKEFKEEVRLLKRSWR